MLLLPPLFASRNSPSTAQSHPFHVTSTRLFSTLDPLERALPPREIFTQSLHLESGRQVQCHFVLLRLDRSCLIWVGTSSAPPMLHDLTLAINKPSLVATTIYGQPGGPDEASAARLCKRTGLVVTFSSALEDAEADLVRREAERVCVRELACG